MSLGAAADLKEVLCLCVEAAIRASGLDCGGIYLIDDTSGALDLAFQTGLAASFVEAASHYSEDSDNARVVMAGQPMYTRHQDLGVALGEARVSEHLHAIAIIPIVHEGCVVGSFNVASHTIDEVPLFARGALETIASQVGSAIASKRAQEKQRISEEKLRGILESSPDGITVTDLEGKVTDCNRATLQIHGFASRQELVGKSAFELIARPEHEAAARNLERTLTEGTIRNVVYTLLTKNGREFPGELSASLIQDSVGNPAGFVAITRDISERKRAEEALRDSEERLKILFECAPDGYHLSDLQGTFVDANRMAEELVGYNKFELIGKSFLAAGEPSLLSPDDILRAAQLLAENASGRPTGPDEFTLKRKDGGEVTVEIRTYPVNIRGQNLVLGITRDITRRKQDQEALQRREQELRDVFDNANDVIVSVDTSGKVVNVNSKVREMFGLLPEEAIGRGFMDLGIFDPDALGEVSSRFNKALKDGAVFRPMMRVKARHRDGHTVIIDLNGAVLRTAVGQLSGFMAVLRDVTEIDNAQQVIRDSEERFRTLLQRSSDTVMIMDAQGTISYVSPSVEHVTGYSCEEVVGKNFTDFTHPDEWGDLFRSYDSLLNAPDACITGEWRICTKSGSWRTMEGTASNLLGEPTICGVVINVRDITARKEAEESLRGTEERFRALIEEASDAVAILDTQGTVVYESPSVRRITGFEAEELVGDTILTSIHPDDAAKVADAFACALGRPGEPVPVELRYRHREGSWIWLEAVGRNLLDNPHIQGVVANFRDITERKRVEQDLEHHAVDLARSNAELQRFAHVASHDLKEPLRTVGSYVQLLARRYKGRLDTDADEFIGYAVKGVERMYAVIDALLDHCRVSTLDSSLELVNCEGALGNALENLQETIKDNLAVVTYDPLPTVLGDQLQLSQVFQNLVGNAIKFAGEEPPRVHISVEETEKEWVFTVHDNGIGIEQEYWERIFEFFQRLHVQEQYPGAGVGLALCRTIVERFGGRIWVESEPARGSNFRFTVLRAPDDRENCRLPQAKESAPRE
jgi:PAS domain S-box-containing protein